MEPARKRKFSPVWEYFDLISPNKVKCLICKKQLSYNNNTSSMLRHYRALHEVKEETSAGTSQRSRKEELDEALVDMVVKDCQPFSLVEDQGFRAFVNKLDPTYVLPTRQALKGMVHQKYEKAKEEAKHQLEKSSAVTLTADMWTSINMDAYLAVTCHYINEGTLRSVLLGVVHFPKAHTAENLAAASMMADWGIRPKVTALVTDAATNMVACAQELNVRHAICIAHSLNLIVKKALDQTPGLPEIRAKARKLVGLFRCSTTAKERLVQMQGHLRLQQIKLIQEVGTRWSSTFHTLQRLFDLKEPVAAAIVALHTDIPPLTAQEYMHIGECLRVLSPSNDAAVELSQEKQVSASKVIPLLKMLDHALHEDTPNNSVITQGLEECLIRQLREKLHNLQGMSIMTMPTLLDPRFKVLGFLSPSKAEGAVKRLTWECTNIIRLEPMQPPPPPSAVQPEPFTSQAAGPASSSGKLWRHLDVCVQKSRPTQSTTASAMVEVQRYLAEPHLPRTDDPLTYWEKN